MSDYLLAVIGTVILSSLLTAIIPEGKTSPLIKAVTRLACVIAIVSPILQFFQSDELNIGEENSDAFFSETGIETEGTFIQYYSEMRVHECETTLQKELENKFTSVDSVKIEWEFEPETVSGSTLKMIKIVRIYVRLNKQSNEEAIQDMWEYLTQNYCSEVLIE